MHRLLFFFIFYLLIAVPMISVEMHAAGENQQLQVIVSILPQEYFVERIGGKRIKVSSLVQPGHSPATYAPTPNQLAALAASEVYFRIGVPFENGLIPKLKHSIPDLRIIDLRQNIDLLPMDKFHDSHEDDHGDFDPHTWLDPKLALKQSAVILDTLKRIDPDGTKQYESNFASLSNDLKQLDQYLKKTLKPLAGKTIYVFHPAYGYFCTAYGLKQKAVNPDGKEPGAHNLARLIEQAKKDSIRVIFVQPQFSDKAARTIARSMNGSIVALDPLARNYLENMRSMARQLTLALLEKQEES